MAILDIKLPNTILKALRLPQNNPRSQQLKVLKKLLRKARFTEFGQQYRFDEILLSKHPGKKFRNWSLRLIIVPFTKTGGIKQLKENRISVGRERFDTTRSAAEPVKQPANTCLLRMNC